jgi:hypothetical protein
MSFIIPKPLSTYWLDVDDNGIETRYDKPPSNYDENLVVCVKREGDYIYEETTTPGSDLKHMQHLAATGWAEYACEVTWRRPLDKKE